MKYTPIKHIHPPASDVAKPRFARLVGAAAVALAFLLVLAAGPVQPAHAACGGTTQVSNQAELNLAIAAFNGASSPCVFTIELTADIDLTASTTNINNSNSGVELIVDGNGHTVDVQGVLDARAFDIQGDTTVTIRQITVTGGNTVGPSNTGAVITVRDGAMLTLTESTLTGNRGSLGGALTTAGTVIITNSTLNNNQADGGFLALGGAIWNGSGGPATLTLINSTLSGNRSDNAGGAIYNSADGVLKLDSSTISNNEATDGGGIASVTDTTVTLHNSIIANSVGGDCFIIDNAIINAEHSLLEDGLSCVNGTNSNNKTGDPMLAALADNGGPTQTQALQAGSPAIDAGSTTQTTDQRGLLRPAGAAADIGAFEAGANAPEPLRFTIEPPTVQSAPVTDAICSANLVRDDFDDLADSSPAQLDRAIGRYTGRIDIYTKDTVGGADIPSSAADTRYISAFTMDGTYTLDFTAVGGPGPVGYFGFWWSAGDGNNVLEVTRVDGTVETFTTQSIINSPALLGSPNCSDAGTATCHFGNPTSLFMGQNSDEAYAFVNIYAQDDASKISSLRFSETGEGGFESDNHTICTALIPKNQQSGQALGALIILKETGPAGGAGFGFDLTDPDDSSSSFTLDDGQHKTLTDVIVGQYTVTEDDPSAAPGGFTLADLACVDGDPNGVASIVDLASRTATINLDANETVTCTYRNEGPRDYGDAPDSYGTTLAANGAYHFQDTDLVLGATIDTESDGIPTTGADGDDLDNTDDEDALTGSLPDLVSTATSYTLSNIPVVNNTGSAATLYGWLDANGDGQFQAAERVTVSVPNSGATTATLTWNLTGAATAGRSYVRLRISDQAGLTAVGPGGIGEVEDYPLEIINTGTIVIRKQTVPAGDPLGYTFNDNIVSPNTFILLDGQSKVFPNVAPGAYTVTEEQTPDATLTGIRCDDANSTTPSTGDPGAFIATINLDPGETVTCTFTNSFDDIIVVEKVTVPAGGVAFAFVITDTAGSPLNFSLDHGQLYTDTVSQTGTYTITELDPGPGYDLTGVSCEGGGSPVFDGDTVVLDFPSLGGIAAHCTFTNTARSNLAIAKLTLPTGDPQAFSYLASGPDGSATVPDLSHGEDHFLNNRKPGAWTITETVPGGWALSDIDCRSTRGTSTYTVDLANGKVDIDLHPDDYMGCVFINSKEEHITINKVTVPSGGQGFGFNSGAYTLNDGDSFTVDVGANPFTVIEDDPIGNGYTVTDITCTDNQGSPSYTIDVDARQVDFAGVPGLVAGCTYTNTLLGGIIIEKVTEPALTDSFTFIAPLEPVLFALGNGDTQQFHNVLPGRYRVTEASQPAGVRLADIRCDDGNSPTPSVPVVRDGDAIINVDPGETVKCTFINAEDDTIIIKKVTEPAGDTVTDFTFNSDLPGGTSFMLKDSAQKVFTDVVPGQVYSVSEIDPTPGYDLTDLSCFDSNTQQTFQGDLSTRAVSFTPEPGHTIACTFVNRARGKIVINKSVQPPGGSEVFSFTNDIETPALFNLSDDGSKQFPDIQAGQYTVEELVGGADTRLAAITCVDSASNGVPSAGDPATARATINLDPGEVVTCTFTNEKAGDPPAVRLTESFAVTRVEEGKLSGEGSIACYWVTLSTDPGAGEVVVNTGPPTNAQVTVDKSLVTLNASNWNNLTTANRSNFVCVRAVDDHVVDGGAQICRDGNSDIIGNGALVPDKECGDHTDIIPHTIASATAPGYSINTPFERKQPDTTFLPGSAIPALVEDNDQVGVRITESFAVTDLDEDGAPVGLACYWVNLTSMPSAPVTVNVTPGANLAANKTAVTLNGGNWNILNAAVATNQVCLTPVDDNVINPKDPRCALKNQDIFGNGADDRQVCGDYLSHVNHSVSSGDASYNGTTNFSGNGPDFDGNPMTVDVMVRNDDVAKVLTSPAHLNVVEGSSTSLRLKLSSQPSAPVTVRSNRVAAAAVGGTSDQQVTFDSANWDQEQSMTIQIPENDNADGVHEETLTLSAESADANFQNIVIEPVSVVVVDNDSAGVAISTTHLDLSENGGEASYAVSLTSQPAADLTVTLMTGDQLTAAPSQLTFTPANWQQAQTIRVAAVDDARTEVNGHAGLIRHTVASSDLAYNAITVSDVGATIEDNDAGGLESMDADGLQVAEGGAGASYGLRLSSRPESEVVVRLNGGEQLTISPSSLTFTPANWAQAQAVSVTAVDDAVDEGNAHVGVVNYSLSGDPAYAGLPVSEQLVTIADNDVAGLALSTTTLDIASGATGSYAVSLTSRPVETVLVDLATAGAVQLEMPACDGSAESGPCLVFTPENWNQPQNVTVRATGPGQVSHGAVSSDAVYDGLSGQSVRVNGGGASFDIFLFLPVINR